MSETTTVQTIDHFELESWLKILYDNREIAGFIHGTTGIGKSDVITETSQDIAERFDDREFVKWDALTDTQKDTVIENPEDYFVLCDTRLSDMDASDIKGIPLLEGDYADWKPPKWSAPFSQDNAAGVLFLDEFNLGNELVQSSFYQVILDRRASAERFSDDVLILGAGNMEGDRASIHEMPGPLRNRFLHVELERPSPDDWANWAVENDIDARIIDYLSGAGIGHNDLFTFDENKDAYAFATPRTWEFASELIEDKSIEGDKENFELAVKSAVGSGVGQKFISFLETQSNLDIQKYIENPEKAANLDEELNDWSESHALISALASHCRENPDDLERVIKFTYHVEEDELQALQLKLLRRHCEKRLGKLLSDKEVAKPLNHLMEILPLDIE